MGDGHGSRRRCRDQRTAVHRISTSSEGSLFNVANLRRAPRVQSGKQLPTPGGSHCSPASTSTKPSPHFGVGGDGVEGHSGTSIWQVSVQQPLFGGSHSSPSSTWPSPQDGGVGGLDPPQVPPLHGRSLQHASWSWLHEPPCGTQRGGDDGGGAGGDPPQVPPLHGRSLQHSPLPLPHEPPFGTQRGGGGVGDGPHLFWWHTFEPQHWELYEHHWPSERQHQPPQHPAQEGST